MEFDLGCRFAATSGRDRALSLGQGFSLQRNMQSLKNPCSSFVNRLSHAEPPFLASYPNYEV